MKPLQLRKVTASIIILLCFAATSYAQFYGKEAQDLKTIKQTTKQTLDSIVAEHFHKDEYAYDANGNKTSKMSYEWDATFNQWTRSAKCEYTYDAGRKLISYIEYKWDAPMNQWKKGTKYDYVYNTNGNLISKTWLYFINNRWSNANRDEYSYDAIGNLTSWRLSSFQSNHKWIYDQKENYNYDANGNIASGVYYTISDNSTEFQEHEKFTATYNASGNITSLMTYNNWLNGSFQKGKKYEFTYNAYGNIATRLNFFPHDNEWGTIQEVYYYSANSPKQ